MISHQKFPGIMFMLFTWGTRVILYCVKLMSSMEDLECNMESVRVSVRVSVVIRRTFVGDWNFDYLQNQLKMTTKWSWLYGHLKFLTDMLYCVKLMSSMEVLECNTVNLSQYHTVFLYPKVRISLGSRCLRTASNDAFDVALLAGDSPELHQAVKLELYVAVGEEPFRKRAWKSVVHRKTANFRDYRGRPCY